MGFALEAGESAREAVHRIAAEQLDEATELLTTGEDRDKAVHKARKACKRVRALLRLLRDNLGKTTYRRENEAVRDAARTLAGLRDAHVLHKTFDALVADANDPGVYDRLRGEVGLPRAATAQGADVGDAVRRLVAVRARVPDWRIRSKGWDAFAPGLARIHERGADGMQAALQDPSGERLHEWRKSVKHLWHAVEILEPTWPAVLEPFAEQTHELSDVLGDHHDLMVLEAVVAGRTDGVSTPPDLPALFASRGDRLAARAFSLGRRVYADRPKAFVRRMGAAYGAWSDDTAAAAVGTDSPLR